MKNKRFLIFLVIALLAGVATYLLVNNKGNKLNSEDWRKFAVEDTAAITKIFLADRTGKQVLIERKSQSRWVVNNKFDARTDLIRMLLKTIKLVHTKSPVAKNSRTKVMKSLSAKGIKVEIYTTDNDDPDKVYYVGGETPNDEIGTYMMLEGSPEPFVTEILGFEGYLTPRYPADEAVWKDPALFRYMPEDIATVKYTNNDNPEQSFEVINNGKYEVTIKDYKGAALPSVDKITAQKYLGNFAHLVYEDEASRLKPAKVDSIINSKPFGNMVITDRKGKIFNLLFYRVEDNSGDLAADGKPYPYNADRFHARLANEKKLYVFQYFVWDKVTLIGQGATFFMPK